MSEKYIIKNCPATGAGCCGDTCPEITDCPLKQIVEKLIELEEKSIELSYCEFKQYVDEVFLIDVFYSNMLDIQEVE